MSYLTVSVAPGHAAANSLCRTSSMPGTAAPKKMTGALHEVEYPHLHDRASQEAVWEAIVQVAGNVRYPLTA